MWGIGGYKKSGWYVKGDTGTYVRVLVWEAEVIEND